eukprot:scaffold221630_cov30-Tisochrysis_lutea.AAC.4
MASALAASAARACRSEGVEGAPFHDSCAKRKAKHMTRTSCSRSSESCALSKYLHDGSAGCVGARSRHRSKPISTHTRPRDPCIGGTSAPTSTAPTIASATTCISERHGFKSSSIDTCIARSLQRPRRAQIEGIDSAIWARIDEMSDVCDVQCCRHPVSNKYAHACSKSRTEDFSSVPLFSSRSRAKGASVRHSVWSASIQSLCALTSSCGDRVLMISHSCLRSCKAVVLSATGTLKAASSLAQTGRASIERRSDAGPPTLIPAPSTVDTYSKPPRHRLASFLVASSPLGTVSVSNCHASVCAGPASSALLAQDATTSSEKAIARTRRALARSGRSSSASWETRELREQKSAPSTRALRVSSNGPSGGMARSAFAG